MGRPAWMFPILSLVAGCVTPLPPLPYDAGRVSEAGVDAPAGDTPDDRCPAGFVDLDGDPANGCEYACEPSGAIDEPDPLFADADCDGVDGEAVAAIYVSPSGDDMAPGTMAEPVRTIAHALDLAAATDRDVYLDGGTYSEHVVLRDGVGIFGGFDRTTSRAGAPTGSWDRRGDVVSEIEGPAIAVEGTGLPSGTTLALVTVRSGVASGAGAPSIGVRYASSAGTLRLVGVTVLAGDGARGTDGGGGSDGAPGTPASGVTPGGSACGSLGGIGGPAGPNGMAGMPGGDAPRMGGLGGDPGPAVVCPSSGSITGMRGVDGDPGAAGDVGRDGRGGDGLGSVAAGTWSPSDGTDGGDGTDGLGGGGGGAGSGGWVRFTSCIATPGGAGGGGGSGGCHGTGGFGGSGGGASFGVLVFDASVAVEGGSITAGDGGDGGAGGGRGFGGTPGMFGMGVGSGGAGGNGGPGGRGGDGGAGGGGGGGPSIAIGHAGTGTVTSTATLAFGVPGSGGASVGDPGAEGIAATQREL